MRPYQDHAVMQGHITQWQSSELTQAEYCKNHGIKPHIFSYYKKKFSLDSEVAKHSSQLIPVKLVADNASLGSNVSTSGKRHLNFVRFITKERFKFPVSNRYYIDIIA